MTAATAGTGLTKIPTLGLAPALRPAVFSAAVCIVSKPVQSGAGAQFERFLDLHNKANRIVRDFLESEEAIRRYSDDTHLAASICLERMRSDMMVLLQDSGELYLLALIGSEMVHPTDEERVVGVANIVIDTIKKDIANVRGLVNQHASGCPTI